MRVPWRKWSRRAVKYASSLKICSASRFAVRNKRAPADALSALPEECTSAKRTSARMMSNRDPVAAMAMHAASASGQGTTATRTRLAKQPRIECVQDALRESSSSGLLREPSRTIYRSAPERMNQGKRC